jgi:hypothetical protein
MGINPHSNTSNNAVNCYRVHEVPKANHSGLASDYVYKKLGIDNRVMKSVALYVDWAMRYVPDKTPHQELDSAITKLIPECSQQEFRQLIEKATQERLRAALAHIPSPMPTTPSIQQHQQSSPPPPKRLKTLNDLEKRRKFQKSKSAIEKLDILIKTQEEVGTDLTKLTSGAK